MVKLKSEIKSFIYDSVYGGVVSVFKTEMNVNELYLGDNYSFVDNDYVNELFEFSSKEALENDSEGLAEVLEWVD